MSVLITSKSVNDSKNRKIRDVFLMEEGII